MLLLSRVECMQGNARIEISVNAPATIVPVERGECTNLFGFRRSFFGKKIGFYIQKF